MKTVGKAAGLRPRTGLGWNGPEQNMTFRAFFVTSGLTVATREARRRASRGGSPAIGEWPVRP